MVAVNTELVILLVALIAEVIGWVQVIIIHALKTVLVVAYAAVWIVHQRVQRITDT